jgi:hypothetical protein
MLKQRVFLMTSKAEYHHILQLKGFNGIQA